MAGAVANGLLKQAALIDRFADALRRSRLRLACNRFRGGLRRRPVRIRGGGDASVGKFQIEPRPRSDAGGSAHRVALLVAHQRKAARQHAAIGQRRQQLAAVGDARLQPLRGGRERAPRPLGQARRAFAVARDRLALRLRVGEL